MAVDGQALATSLGINGGLCALMALVFSALRVAKGTRRFYAPKQYDPEQRVKPRKLGAGLFSWVGPILSYPEDEIIAVAGLDAAVYLRLLRYGTLLFAFCSLWCCALLMPINGTAGGLRLGQALAGPSGAAAKKGQPPQQNLASEIDLVSISNVPNSPPQVHRLWAHLATVYVVSLFAMALLMRFSRDISTLRARFISTRPRGAEANTVLVTDIPGVGAGRKPSGGASEAPGAAGKGTAGVPTGDGGDGAAAAAGAPPPLPDDVLDPYRVAGQQLAHSGDVEGFVGREMAATYGEQHVGAVNCVRDTSRAEPLLRKYAATKQQLADLLDDYLGKLQRGQAPAEDKRKKVTLLPQLAPKWAAEKYGVGAQPVKVDALEYLPQELESLRGQVQDAAAAASAGPPTPAAFVTFRDRYTQALASAALHSHDESAWRVQPAPGSDEIIWANLGVRHWTRVTRGLGMWAAFAALLVFYLPIVAAVQAVVNLENVRSVPGLGKVADIPFVTQILQGILPSLVLKIFLALLPMILNAMNRFTGLPSVSLVDFATNAKYFTFQVFALFLFSFIIGSALSQISAIINNPTILVTLLGVAAPQQANFFMSYIMLSACSAGFGLLSPVGLVLYLVKSKVAATEKAKYRVWAKQEHTFGAFTANHTMTILLGLAFCAVTPLIAPFALLYFVLVGTAQRYQMVYVLRHPYEASGRMWGNMFNQVMTGVYAHQAVTAAVLGVKRFPFAALVLPLFVATAAFHWAAGALFKRPWSLTSLREAAVLDARDGKAFTPEEAAEVRCAYLHPAFKLDDAEHQELLANATQIDQAMGAGGSVGGLAIRDMEVADD